MSAALRRTRGFTLLELVVAMAIVSLVVVGLYASMRSAYAAKRSVDQAVEPLQRAGLAVDFLKRDLESALPPTGVLANQFIGTTGQDDHGQRSDDLIFTAAVSGPPSVTLPADIRQIEYVVLNDNNEHRLVRRVTSNLLSPTPIDPDDEILCRGVHAFSLRYYYYDTNNVGQFTDTWDSTQPASLTGPQQANTLPIAIEAHLELDPPTPGGAVVPITRLIQLPCAVPATQPGSTALAGGTP